MPRTNLTTFRLCAAALCLKGSDKFGPDGRIPRGWRMTPRGPVCPKHAPFYAPRCEVCGSSAHNEERHERP